MGTDPGMFRALIELCPMVTYVCDAHKRITYISPQIEEWTGIPASRWTDDPEFWYTVIHPDDRARVIAADARTDLLFDVEYRMLGRDGAVLWLWEREVRIPGSDTTQGVCLDITALREAQEALHAAQARLGAVVNAAPVILFATDAAGIMTVSEGKALEHLGYAPGEIVGRSVFEVYAGHDEIQRAVRRALAGERFENRIELGELTFDCSWRGMEGGGMMGIAIDVSARRRSEEQLAHLAFHDPLTGLGNRRALERELDRELARAALEGSTVAALYIDLDHFKFVNDSLGHAVGDRVLAEVARRIGAVTRSGDLLARLGGDEFVLLCAAPAAGAAEAAHAVARKVIAALDASLVVDGAEFQLGASIGIALGPQDGEDATELLKHADAAMYQAKRDGRDTAMMYCDDRGATLSRLTLTARLRRALLQDEFLLHYQPVYELATGKLHALEALVRWLDPAVGLVPPGDFIPHAEETGLITQIGAWVVDAVARQSAAWRAQGLDPRIAFNVAPRELRDDGYVGRVADALARHGVPPGRVMIEVTESAMDARGRCRATLEGLDRLGVRLAIDDFGTEHSSLSRLRELPVRVLKVDRAFLRDLPGDTKAAAIVRAIATLGAGLDMTVVAEGIETEAQRQFVQEAGCRYGQGYYFARPLPADAVTPLLATSPPAPRPRAARASARARAALPR